LTINAAGYLDKNRHVGIDGWRGSHNRHNAIDPIAPAERLQAGS
jgi:hypothetical protein